MTVLRQRWIVAVIALGACARAEGDSEDLVPAQTGTPQAVTRVVNVESRVIEPRDFTDFIRITGQAEANHDILVSTEEGGVLGSFPVAKGSRVSRGQVLARIDSRILAAQIDEARASALLAADQFERQRRLWEDEGLGTEIAFVQARYQAEMAQARLATLEARLAKTTIRAPVTGIFEERFVDPGEIVAPGSQVARVVAIDSIKVSGGVPERYAANVARGESARITFDILPGQVFEGRIGYVGSTVDQESRTFPVEVVIRNPSGVVKPSMVANVRLVRQALKNVIVIQQDHVVRSETGYYVFVLEDREGGPVASRRTVRLGAATGNDIVIEEGLAAGDRLVTLGAQLVDEGSRVRVIESAVGEEAVR